ncbi:MAG: 2-hydroxyglutaryl-CoA dehydratase [Proteobacteria bacterium]|nr:2-hydroxyglutaryl-CoA dehydratase [Pseudomonadota bacterium]
MFIGIDLGSRRVKIVLMEGREITRTRSFDTLPFYKRYGTIRGGKLWVQFDRLDFPDDPRSRISVTGYGRNNINLSGGNIVTEIQAHTRGALFQTGLRDFTLVDLGGQDTKVAYVEKGRVRDFLMNDKCAAGSGRYLENMAKVLAVSLKELGKQYDDPIDLDTTCAIFGESEMIGNIIEGTPIPRICAGVNLSVVKRVLPLINRFPRQNIVVSGGVAKNRAIIKLLEHFVHLPVIVPKRPAFNGAIGCALLSRSAHPLGA